MEPSRATLGRTMKKITVLKQPGLGEGSFATLTSEVSPITLQRGLFAHTLSGLPDTSGTS